MPAGRFEQIAPGRVDRHGQVSIIICRTDANPTASAWFEPAHSAVHADGGHGDKGSKPRTAKKSVESAAGWRGKSEDFTQELAAKAAGRAQGL